MTLPWACARVPKLFMALGAIALTAACEHGVRMPHEAASAGPATVTDATRDAFGQPMPGLSQARRHQFFVGNSFFNLNWVSAPASVSDRDGLGPLFNARSCSGCHFKDGRGRPPEAGENMLSMLVRISVPGAGPNGAPLPDPIYGDQLQSSAVPGLTAEAEVTIEYRQVRGTYPDGEVYELLSPSYRIARTAFGPASTEILLSPRVAPALVGLGLLEAVPDATLELLASETEHEGITGRINRVPDLTSGALSIGRFGWKAEQPSVLQQTAGAFNGDMGLTSRLFTSENHTARQSGPEHFESGGAPEVSDEILDQVTTYVGSLGVPARRDVALPQVSRGEDLFLELGCASCHVPTLPVASKESLPEIGIEEIHPYTDLLLHDMGEGLSDHRQVYGASGSEWRTPPLWGLGLVSKVNGHTRLLHDGRARSTSEAILWHDGEAKLAREAFIHLQQVERTAVLAFLASL
jgi:CxxC motif-containing protein (DUF1111 family)